MLGSVPAASLVGLVIPGFFSVTLRCFTGEALAGSHTLISASGGLILDSDRLKIPSGVMRSVSTALVTGPAILRFFSVTLRCFTGEALVGSYTLISASDAPGLPSDMLMADLSTLLVDSSMLGSGSDTLSVSLYTLKFVPYTNAGLERRTF